MFEMPYMQDSDGKLLTSYVVRNSLKPGPRWLIIQGRATVF